jgi:pimeloyl-ACP methyl ester carboxylesterase
MTPTNRVETQAQASIGRDTLRLSRRRMLMGSGAALAALGLLGAAGLASPSMAQAQDANSTSASTPSTKPVIVLVHGAWADASGWSKVIKRLQADHYIVVAPAVSLSSLSADIAAVRKVISDLGVPVLVAGHSYGGAVITGAASGLANEKGLV